MTSHPPHPSASGAEKPGALDELLNAEREISDLLAATDADAERILESERDVVAAMRATAAAQLIGELDTLEITLRAAVSDDTNALRTRTRALTEKFLHATDADVTSLADFVLQRLYGLAPSVLGYES